MSDHSDAWYHCTRCGHLFKAAASLTERGACPECAHDPATGMQTSAPAPAMVKVRKTRKPRKPSSSQPVEPGDTLRSRGLLVFVVVWVVVLAAGAMIIKRRGGGQTSTIAGVENALPDSVAAEDLRLIRDNLEGCGKRLGEFFAATEIGGRALHVVGGERTVPRMARVQQFNPIFPSISQVEIESYTMLHTPIGRAIETLWKQEDGELIEAVFFEDEGEWKIDWDALARAGTDAWPLFLAGRGPGEGEFRLLARERIGANGQDAQFIGLVLYSTRSGHPGEAVSPSPEIRVDRNSLMGRQIEEAFVARKNEIGPYGSKVISHDPDDMIRLRVKVTREGDEERLFRITELLATHWMQLDPPRVKAE